MGEMMLPILIGFSTFLFLCLASGVLYIMKSKKTKLKIIEGYAEHIESLEETRIKDLEQLLTEHYQYSEEDSKTHINNIYEKEKGFYKALFDTISDEKFTNIISIEIFVANLISPYIQLKYNNPDEAKSVELSDLLILLNNLFKAYLKLADKDAAIDEVLSFNEIKKRFLSYQGEPSIADDTPEESSASDADSKDTEDSDTTALKDDVAKEDNKEEQVADSAPTDSTPKDENIEIIKEAKPKEDEVPDELVADKKNNKTDEAKKLDS